MLLTKANNKKEKSNSIISDCFNGHMDNLQKKKNIHDRNFKLKMSLNPKQNQKSEENENIVKETFSIEKKINQKNFDKKYSNILNFSESTKQQENFPQKNLNLWDLKLKKNSLISKDQSLKKLENFKLNMLYSNSKYLLNLSNEKMQFSQQNFGKKSSNCSSDFFKSTINSETRTFSSSKNSFYPSTSKNSFYPPSTLQNINFSGTHGNFYNEKNATNTANPTINANPTLNANANANFNANMSFNSFKSVSSSNNFRKKSAEFDAINNNTNYDLNLSPRSPRSSTSTSKGKLNTKRVNFDDFNFIGENPYKINIHDYNNIAVNNTSKNYSKYGNMKNGYNLSPKNICSSRNSLNYHSNKSLYKIDDIFENNNNPPSPRGGQGQGLGQGGLLFDSNKINSPKKTGFQFNKTGTITNEFLNSRHFTLKRIDNLMNNFANSTAKKGNIGSPKNHKNNSEATFLKGNNKQRLLNLLK